jgi:predicted TIM-barrel fold metal-dependent hydrolase
VGLAFLPFHDVEASVAEIHWAAEHGLNGITLPSFHYDLPEYVHGWYWDPIWRACEEVGFSLNAHGGNGLPALGTHSSLMAIDVPFFAQRPLGHLVMSGVFDRFQDLKFAVTEASASWIPTYLATLDGTYSAFKAASTGRALVLEDPNLPERLPSEYWPTNGFVGVSLVKLAEMEARHTIGVDTMMYGVDYPHPEGTWGQATTWVQASLGRAGASPDEARAMLGLNAIRCYNLDTDLLQQVADRVGPTIEEVLATPTDAELEAFLGEANATGRVLAARHLEGKPLT